MALPLLDTMLPARAADAVNAAKGPLRLSVLYMPNGMIMQNFVPKDTGTNYTMSETLKPLEAQRDQFVVITGLAHKNATPLGDGPGDHGRACGSYLTGMHPKKTEGYDLSNGISMDQYVARETAKVTEISSLELSLEPPGLVGSCDSGYSCAYTNTLSWSDPRTPLPTTVDPRTVFERLFGDGDKIDQASRLAQMRHQASILDYVMTDAQRLSKKLSTDDLRKMDEYMTSVRDVERRIQKVEAGGSTAISSDMSRPSGIPDSYMEHAKMMIDLQVLAMRADLTRVTSLMMANEISNHSYTEIGISDAHHSISHHGGDPVKLAKLVRIEQMFLGHYAYYLQQLKAAKEGDGTLFDRTVAWAGPSLGDSNTHDHLYMPLIIGGGLVKGNRHIAVAKETPMSNALVSAMNLVGVQQDRIGDSTGPLSELTDA
ncbi:MAG TPA: DUF1552 domain-containing protein [Rhizomicrobium sp.]|nr:DUF1552 domain-containing protein [Rhizomicrobium sp.]